MNYKLLVLSILSCFSASLVHPFSVINGSFHPLSLQLDWYANNESTKSIELARVEKPIHLQIGDTQEIQLSSQFEELWVTILYEDGSREEAFKLVVPSYEPDKGIDNTCALLIKSSNNTEVKFNVVGKMLAKAMRVKFFEYQKALIKAKSQHQSVGEQSGIQDKK